RESGRAVAHSAANAAIVGAICGLLCVAAWSARSVAMPGAQRSRNGHGGHRGGEGDEREKGMMGKANGPSVHPSLRLIPLSVSSLHSSLLTLMLLLFTAAAFIPGVLIGSATLTAWSAPFLPFWLADTDLPLILAHTARFAFLPLLAGWF